MSLFDNTKAKVANLINRMFEPDRKSQIESIIQISNGWKPKPHKCSFKDEQDTRLAYFHGSMQKDMDAVLKARYPQTYEGMQDDQVNYKVLRKKIKDKAKVFLKKGKLYLVDDKGSRVENDDQKRFQDLLDSSRFFSNCKQVDEYTQLCHRALFKPWWDDVKKVVQISIWPPQMIHVAPDPWRWWDLDAAYAVLLELPGVDGLTTVTPRYEVWGYRDIEAAAATRQQTIHYISDGKNDRQVNNEDKNPFSWQGKPIYPFVLWKDDETTDLFRVEEDMLTINRAVNCHATDTHCAMKYLAWPIIVFTQGEGGPTTLGVKKVGPGEIVDLHAGSSLELLHPDLNLGEHREYLEAVIRDDAMLDGMSSSTLRTEKAAPESGYAVKLHQKPLAEHRENNIEIYRPFLLESAKRVVIVHNTYSKDKIALEKYKLCWEPGEMEIPENPEEVANNELLKISKNVSSSIEWRMKETGEDRQTAEKSVQKNLEDNEKYTKPGEIPDSADNRAKEGEQDPENGENAPEKAPPFGKKPEKPDETEPEG